MKAKTTVELKAAVADETALFDESTILEQPKIADSTSLMEVEKEIANEISTSVDVVAAPAEVVSNVSISRQ